MAEQRKETFGSSITEGVYNQLTARSNLYSKTSKNKLDQVAINSNTAYIKVRSSINILDNDGNKSPYYAKNFVLAGGALKVGEEGYRAGVSKEKARNFTHTDKAYNNYNSLGFRPMPGITGFRISSQNTYGTIRIAEIDFTVWTVEDLEIAEKIYLKPGYSMLVEWGHTVFINNSGEIRRAGNELYTIPDKEWFKLGQKSSKILELIDTKRRNSSYNYDAFWGYCSNFSYSFRPDGGYNCSIKIISAGQVLESIKAGNTEATGKPKEKDADEDLQKQKSPFHLIFRTLDEYTKANDGDVDFQGNVLDRLKEKIEFKVKGFEPFSCFMHELTLIEEGTNIFGGTRTIRGEKQSMVYLPFKAVLDIFNKTCSIYDTDNEPIIKFDNTYGEKFLTFNEHFCADPFIGIMPKPAKGYEISSKEIQKMMAQSAITEDNKTNDIMDIYLNTGYLASKLDSFIDGTQKTGTGMFDFFKGICADLNTVFVINNFDIFYNETNNTYRIVDRKSTSRERTKVINLTGLKSTVTELNISSKITPNIASQISIAAVGSEGAQYKDNVSNIMKWNQGAFDRIVLDKKTEPGVETLEQDDQCGGNYPSEEYKTEVKDLWDNFNNGQYDNTQWDAMKPQMKTEILRRYNCSGEANRLKGVVPVELSLKMEGIAGLKIAQAFRINKGILPKKYDDWGYIITGLDHEIGTDNKWFTNIKTQFYYDQNG